MYISIDPQHETQGHKKIVARKNAVFDNEVFLKKLSTIKCIKDIRERMDKSRALAKEYSLDFSIGSRLHSEVCHPAFRKIRLKQTDEDVCRIKNGLTHKLEEIDCFHATGEMFLSTRELEQYPIHLWISPQASKRDVLDYINKNWHMIRANLDQYDKKLPVYREPMNKKRDDYIWRYRDLPAQELANKVNKKFPNYKLVYSDINKILYKLRKQRLSQKV